MVRWRRILLALTNTDRKSAYGLEQYYDEILRGRDGEIRAESDALGDETLPFDLPQGSNCGGWLDTGFDAEQRDSEILPERELQKGLAEFGARTGQILIMEPKTGKILALASAPAPDVNAFLDDEIG